MNIAELLTTMNADLEGVNEWLSVNVGKTKCMAIGKPRFMEEAMAEHQLVLKGMTLEWVCQCKYLVFIIDRKLNCRGHVEYVNNKTAKKVNLLYKLCLEQEKNCRLY